MIWWHKAEKTQPAHFSALLLFLSGLGREEVYQGATGRTWASQELHNVCELWFGHLCSRGY